MRSENVPWRVISPLQRLRPHYYTRAVTQRLAPAVRTQRQDDGGLLPGQASTHEHQPDFVLSAGGYSLVELAGVVVGTLQAGRRTIWSELGKVVGGSDRAGKVAPVVFQI